MACRYESRSHVFVSRIGRELFPEPGQYELSIILRNGWSSSLQRRQDCPLLQGMLWKVSCSKGWTENTIAGRVA